MRRLGLIIVLVAFFVVLVSASSRYRRAAKTVKLVTAFVGSSVTFTCDTTLKTFNLVEWRRNDSANAIFLHYNNHPTVFDRRLSSRASITDKKNLRISNLKLGDQDVYFCKVVNSNTGGSESGSPIKLIVLDSPRCDGAPAGLFVAKVVGSTSLLPCKVAGNPFPVIEWTKNDGILPEGRYAVTDSGLTIKHLKKEDSGYYQVTLKNIAGTTEVVIQLIVKSAASVLPGHYIDAIENQMKSIPCGPDEASKDSKLTWKRNGADPTRNSRFTLNTASGSLVINRVNRKDSGSYNCSVMKIENGKIVFKTYEMYFNVQYPPEIIYHFMEETAVLNESVSLPCVAIGNPAANITWEWKGKKVVESPRVVVGPNGSLIIENVTRKDEGVYTCTPRNKWPGEKKTTKLVVLVPPSFKKKQPFVQKVKVGENVTFDCSATGIPKPNITWPPVLSPWPQNRIMEFKDGRRKIVNAQLTDFGQYRCVVVSNAGVISRDFMLILVAKPYKPVNITSRPIGDAMLISWLPHSSGVIVQEFELWYRRLGETDYHWKSTSFGQSGNETRKFVGIFDQDNVIRIRGRNNEGLGPFSEPYVVYSNGSSFMAIEPEDNAKTPLAPLKMQVNTSKSGYLISWQTTFAPGRPEPDYFTIQTKTGNDSWTPVGGNIPKTARQYILKNSDIEQGVMYSFRMYAVGTKTSEAAMPKFNRFEKSTMPENPTSPVVKPRKGKRGEGNEDKWPTIILAIIFSVFVFILILSLICFLRATGRLGGYRSQRRESGALLDEKMEGDLVKSNGKTSKAASNGIKVAAGKISQKKNQKKAPFHYENCPIKLVSDYESNDYERLVFESSAHVIFSESPEKCQCDHRRCMTLPRKPAQKVKKPKTSGLYKSVSSPNVITNSNGKIATDNDLTVETVINDNDYDLSESEDGDFVDSKLPTIDRKFSKMKNSKMIDSYDQFCRSPSDFGSKDMVRSPRDKDSKQKPANGDHLISPRDDGDEKQRMLSATESENIEMSDIVVKEALSLSAEPDRVDLPDEEIRKSDDLQSDSATPPEQGSKENVFDDPNDASSENSVAESDQRVFALTASRLRHPSAKPGYAMRSSSQNDEPEKRLSVGLTSIKETPSKVSLNSMDKHSLRSYDLRSSGIESEGKQHSYTSDTESVTNSIPPVTSPYKFKDIDVMSDISTRSSPGPLRRGGPYLGYDEHYEWDLPKHRNYGRPLFQSPKKEKSSDRKDATDNEDLFRSIMKMQQQLGVDLADSWENLSEDTNLSLVCNGQTPLFRDGYASDVPSSFTDRVSTYSEREKARRCAELLQELKRNNPKQATKPTHPIKRSLSAANDYTRTKPLMPPYKRSNSACEDETVFHEWLV